MNRGTRILIGLLTDGCVLPRDSRPVAVSRKPGQAGDEREGVPTDK